jgi:cell division protein FtsL
VEEGIMRKIAPVIRGVLLFFLLLGSLTLVVWRQSRALEMQRALETVRQERAVEESRRTALLRRAEQLESRTRVSVAAGRMGMRLPSGDELVILPLLERGGGGWAGGPGRAGVAVVAARGGDG